MKGKLIASFVLLLALTVLPVTANAIGPQKAKNNPHIVPAAAIFL